jgi:hypothetical protein
VFRLTNDASVTVNVADCGGSQLCVAVSKASLAPGKTVALPLSSASIGSTPNSVAIHQSGHPMVCLTIPGAMGGTYSANVSQGQAQECTLQDRHSV